VTFGGSQQANVAAGAATWGKVAAGAGNATNSTSLVINLLVAASDGDLLFLYVAGFCADGAGSISCSGFTTQIQGAGNLSASHPFWAGTRIASGEGTVYTVSFTAAAWAVGCLLVLRSTTGVKMVANTAVYDTASGYTTSLPNPSPPLTIATPLDATIYAWGGQDSVLSGASSVDLQQSGMSDIFGTGTTTGACAGCGWAVNAASPGLVQILGGNSADPVDVALDITPN
jgi:hypothetical protein